MKEPILVVMAAGMGSRYGGLKQIDPVGKNGEIIIDFSLYDAIHAGFKKVIFIIKKEIEEDFKNIIGNRISKMIDVEYAYQDINDIPKEFSVPNGRTKPWGTGHAVLACRDLIDAPFAAINADDYYGREAFQKIYNFLLTAQDDGMYRYGMVGYILNNTLTENGHVARGVCAVENGILNNIVERTHIEKRMGKAQFTEDGENWVSIPNNSVVSMNLWGFTPSIITELQNQFALFLKSTINEDPLKSEYFLPTVVNNLIQSKKASVRVLTSKDKWYGVTYRLDKPVVEQAIADLISAGVYSENLWAEQN